MSPAVILQPEANTATAPAAEVLPPASSTAIAPAVAAPVTINVPKKSNSNSFLAKIGRGFKDVFTFLASPKGQAAVSIVEDGIETAVPQSTALINIANTYMTEAIKTETLAAAAGSQEGTNTQKAIVAVGAVTPQALAFAQAQGLETPTAEEIQKGMDLMVEFANLWKVKAAS
jgi:hypothetical protein